MMEIRPCDLVLHRITPDDEDGIYGKLHVPMFPMDEQREVEKYDTLERPWLGNRRRISCIPTGVYKLRKRTWGRYYTAYKKRWNHAFVLEITGVDGRDHILLHAGNLVEHSAGCPLIGNASRDPCEKLLECSRDRYADFYQKIAELYSSLDEIGALWDEKDRHLRIKIVNRPKAK